MQNSKQIKGADVFYDEFHQLHKGFGSYWQEGMFLHWEWWISALLAVGAWVFWIFYRKKDSTSRLLYAGLISISIGICFDYVGEALGLWHYAVKILPTFPAFVPFHFCLLPVVIMFLIQTKPHIAPWKKGVVFSLLTSYVGEPIFVWAGIYVMTGWHYIYSLPLYFLLFLFCDAMAKRTSFQPVSNN
ncbi:CBO0543 family protein [Lentibacillus songyuanensis]|uniref:CBO0543 family protein n=1 Tax=Lentibacillus songyuanensis TaxID=3136161 RepID=UPI0031BA6E9E